MLSQDKKRLRPELRAARLAVSDDLRRETDRALCARILSHPAVDSARTVMSYMAFGGEPDLSVLHCVLGAAGKRLCFPVCTDGGIMLAMSPEDGGAFERGKYGILSPAPGRSVYVPPVDIDVIIVPCVAFDADRRRLGQGGGYYDRFLPLCTGSFSIGAAYDLQRLDDLPAGPRDVRLDAIATEIRWY